MFVLETDGSTLSRLLLYPTVIQQFQARRAQNGERRAIVASIQKLSEDLHTAATWNEQQGCLEIHIK